MAAAGPLFALHDGKDFGNKQKRLADWLAVIAVVQEKI